MDKMKMVQPQWIRLVHANGKFAAEIDTRRGVIRFVDRGGTITYDVIALMVEAQQDSDNVDSVAMSAG